MAFRSFLPAICLSLLTVLPFVSTVGPAAAGEQLVQEPTQNDKALAAGRAFDQAQQLIAEGSATSLRAALGRLAEALQLYRDVHDRQHEALVLTGIGFIQNLLGEKQKALDFYSQALPIYRAVGDRGGEATILGNIAAVYDSLGEKQKALAYHMQALPIWRALGDHSGEALTLNNIGSVYDSLGEKQKALVYYLAALPLSKEAGDRRGEATILNNLGGVLDSLGVKQKAIDCYLAALSIFRALGERRSEATILSNVAAIYDSLGRKQEALDYLSQALPITRELGDRSGEATTLNNLGGVYDSLSEKQKALDYYAQALALTKAVGDRYGEARTLNNIGAAYNSLGEKQQALDYYEQALAIRKSVGDRTGQATTLGNIGSVYDSLGEKQQALDYYAQALPLSRAALDRKGEATTLNNIGYVYDSLGEKQQALDYYAQALTIFKAIGDRNSEAATINNLGSVHDALGDKQQALDYYAQALSIWRAVGDHKGEATTFTSIGVVYNSLGEQQKALDYYLQALPISRAAGDRKGEATTLNNIGFVYESLGDKQKALDYYEQALPIRRAVGDRAGEATTLDNLQFFWRSTNQRMSTFCGKLAVDAYQHLRSNISGLDKEVQKTYLRSVEPAYRVLAATLLAQGRLSEAQEVLDLFKDQQFFDFNRDSQQPARALTLTPYEALFGKRYDQVTNRLDLTGQQLEQLKRSIGTREPNTNEAAQLQQLGTQFKSDSDEFRALLKQAQTEFNGPPSAQDKVGEVTDTKELQAALRQLQQQTGQKAVASYTLVGEDQFWALLITANNITAVSQPVKGQALNEKARQFWALLQAPAYDPTKLAQELYAILFKPLEGQLDKDTDTILWSLDGNLRYLPMGALYDGRRYLVERYNQVVFTRADKERLLRAVSPRWTGLGLGSSEPHTVELLGDKFHFGALPGVQAELHVFRRKGVAGGVLDGEVLLDAGFTRAAMIAALQQKRALVHISSHFSFRPGDEARSFLLLGDGTPFTLAEMKRERNLFEGVELLTLSACNTAAQQPGADGREIDGLAELAQRLGAGAVLATLWPVADNSTPWLMREFYQDRESGKRLTKAEAIRQAQLALLKGTAQPKPLPEAAKGESSSSFKLVVGGEGSRAGSSTRSDIVYVGAQDAPAYKKDEKRPFAHPYYWAPFILIGNWK